MFVPTKENLTVYQGATFRKIYAVQVGGQPLDMSGWKARMQIKYSYDDVDAAVTLTTENGGLALDVENSQLSIYISPAQTASLTGSGVYDLELVDAASDVGRLRQGKIKLDLEVTTYEPVV